MFQQTRKKKELFLLALFLLFSLLFVLWFLSESGGILYHCGSHCNATEQTYQK